MTLLPIHKKFVEDQMDCRFLRSLDQGDTVIVAIPGGPALSSVYLDPFMMELAKKTGANVATMDLPNHGDSKIHESYLPITYENTVGLVAKTIDEITSQCSRVVIFGQSLGARLAFDILGSLRQIPSAVILTGFPYKFEISSNLISRLNELPLETETGPDAEAKHARNWEKILPLYAVQPLSDDARTALLQEKDIKGNELMLDAAPAIEMIAPEIPEAWDAPICIIQSENDPVVPDQNWSVLSDVLPEATFCSLNDVGHFPMIENQMAVLEIFHDFIAQEGSK